jgi:Permease for cytosine/purines, uracil, thiamine, allantoin
VIICSAPAVLLENPTVFENYGVYLAYIAMLTGTYGGIMVADYLLVSRGIHPWRLRDIYSAGPASRYWYTAGFNPAALVATVAGAAFTCGPSTRTRGPAATAGSAASPPACPRTPWRSSLRRADEGVDPPIRDHDLLAAGRSATRTTPQRPTAASS